MFNEGYTIEIARNWNTKDAASGYAGYVTRFVWWNRLSQTSINDVDRPDVSRER